MHGMLFLKDYDGTFNALKLDDMIDHALDILNKKVITYLKMVVSDESLVDLEGLTTGHVFWENPRNTYEITTLDYQMHLIRKLVTMQLFNDELKAIFCLSKVNCPI